MEMDFMQRPKEKNLHVTLVEVHRRGWAELNSRSWCSFHDVLNDGLLRAEWLLELMPEKKYKTAEKEALRS